MSLPPSSSLLDETLRTVVRRYRVPAPLAAPATLRTASTATLVWAIEQAREAAARGKTPDAATKRLFLEALAQLIQAAMRVEGGDAAFQAMVLEHRATQVREYVSLSARAGADRRHIHARVNALAHPARLRRLPPGEQREALARLHAAAASASWQELGEIARRLLDMPQVAADSAVAHGLGQVLDDPALGRLMRLAMLAHDDLVRRYCALRERHGPLPGSAEALAQGAVAQRRGAAVEALAAQAIEMLAGRLNQAGEGMEQSASPAVEGGVKRGLPDPALRVSRADGEKALASGESRYAGATYRVVTSMRVPAVLAGDVRHAKSEWDVVLLRRARWEDAEPVWDVCLLVEAKAGADAAASDLPRLRRGVRLLANAGADTLYAFDTRQGVLRLRGASLAALAGKRLAEVVLYCCNAPAEASPRLLGAASRMRLLGAPASMAFAGRLLDKRDAEVRDLEPVWHELLESPRWAAVRNQYPIVCEARELMVHIDDLRDAIDSAAGGVPSTA